MSVKKPSKDVLEGVFEIFHALQIKMDPSTVEVVAAALCHWLETTKRGHEFMAHLLKLSPIKGLSEKRYLVRNHASALTREIDPEKIVFLRGCVASGEIISLLDLDIEDRDLESCSNCGSRTICVGGSKGECSYCDKHGDQFGAEDLRRIKIDCETCTDARCYWHPSNIDVPIPNEMEKHYVNGFGA